MKQTKKQPSKRVVKAILKYQRKGVDKIIERAVLRELGVKYETK